MSRYQYFLGWPMVGIAFLLYGLGLGPAYYSWGFLAPELIDDLELSRQEIGNLFGLFTLTFALTSPVAAAAVSRIGLRPVIALGSSIAAYGFWRTASANDANDLLLSYALLGGVGVGLCTLLPAQTLPVYWFRRYRARATALIVLGAGVFGALVPTVDDWIIQHGNWRSVWQVVAAISLGIGFLAALGIRARPSDVGQQPDGLKQEPSSISDSDVRDGSSQPVSVEFNTKQAILSVQFLLVTFACLANTVPWRVVTAHGRLHLEDLGFASSVAAGILGVRVGMSAIGRLSGSLGDFLDPRHVLGISLTVSCIGLVGFAFVESVGAAYAWIVLLGIGYGIGFTSEPLVVARLFGSRAFIGSNGLRIALTGIAGWLAPLGTGASADRTVSYEMSFVLLGGLCLAGALTVAFCRSPKRPDSDGLI